MLYDTKTFIAASGFVSVANSPTVQDVEAFKLRKRKVRFASQKLNKSPILSHSLAVREYRRPVFMGKREEWVIENERGGWDVKVSPKIEFPAENLQAYEIKKNSKGKFQIIGAGSWGRVFSAEMKGLRGTELNRNRVIKASVTDNKTLTADSVLSRTVAPLLQNEFDIVSQISHTNVVQVFDVLGTYHVDAKGKKSLVEGVTVMESIDGGDLEEWLQEYLVRASDLAPADWLAKQRHIVFRILLGVCYFHSQGIMHRDIKPANIMRTLTEDDSEGEILLIDFSFATKAENGDLGCGTRAYMAPELLRRVRS